MADGSICAWCGCVFLAPQGVCGNCGAPGPKPVDLSQAMEALASPDPQPKFRHATAEDFREILKKMRKYRDEGIPVEPVVDWRFVAEKLADALDEGAEVLELYRAAVEFADG